MRLYLVSLSLSLSFSSLASTERVHQHEAFVHVLSSSSFLFCWSVPGGSFFSTEFFPPVRMEFTGFPTEYSAGSNHNFYEVSDRVLFFFRAAHVSSLSVSSSFTGFFSVLYRVVVVVATDLLRCVLFPAIWWQRGALLRELRFLFFHFFCSFFSFFFSFFFVVVVVVSVSFSGCAAALPERRFIGQRSDGLRFN